MSVAESNDDGWLYPSSLHELCLCCGPSATRAAHPPGWFRVQSLQNKHIVPESKWEERLIYLSQIQFNQWSVGGCCMCACVYMCVCVWQWKWETLEIIKLFFLLLLWYIMIVLLWNIQSVIFFTTLTDFQTLCLLFKRENLDMLCSETCQHSIRIMNKVFSLLIILFHEAGRHFLIIS